MTGDQLILVGANAAGKTTVGRLLALRRGLPLFDTDELLSEELGLSLPEAWASLPATELEAAEATLCRNVLRQSGVIALGSRAVTDPELRSLLRGRAVVWLRVSSTHLTRRLGMASLGMATLAPLRSQMDALLASREPWYEEVASLALETDRLTPAAVADRIEQAWEGSS